MDIMSTQEAKDESLYTNTMIVDGLNLAFRFKHNKTKNFAPQYLGLIQSLAKSYEAKNVIILGDGGSNYRYDIFPEYKSPRKERYANQSEEEAKEFQEFLNDFGDALELCNTKYNVLKFMGVEADDIAAYIVKHYAEELEHVWLISSDHDWDLLVSEHVSRFSYRTRKEITLDNWDEHYGYTPEQHISIKVLTGDKSDGIPGVEQIGIKRAETLMRTYDSAFDIHDAIPIDSKYKYIQNLNNFKDNIMLNYQLMDLITYCDEALGEENCQEVDAEIEDILSENQIIG